MSTQPPNGCEQTNYQAFRGMRWECGEANCQDECPYPIKTLCTKCWGEEAPKDRWPSRLCFHGM